jgi:UDP-glucose 4-epimerase
MQNTSVFMHNVLVTGGAGFIGHHLVKGLSSIDCKITIVDNLSNANKNFLLSVRNTSLSSNINPMHVTLYDNDVSLYKEDIRNKEAIIDICKREDIDTCVHLAAKISVSDSVINSENTIDVNVRGTLNVLEARSKMDVRKFVFASSSAVYGEPKLLPISEEQQLDPLSPYGASKIAGEALVSSFRNTRKIQNAVSLRIFNVFGEGQSSEYAGVITKFAERLSASLPPLIYGDGNQTRDFISVDDVVSAIVLLLASDAGKDEENSSPSSSSPRGHVFNVGTGKATKIKDLAHMMIKIFDLDLEPLYSEPRRGDIVNSFADIGRLKTGLRFVPSNEIDVSLKKMFMHAC